MPSLWQVDSPYVAEPLGGRASFGEIFSGARRETELAENTNSAMRALEQAYDERIDQVRHATGETLTNPLRAGLLERFAPAIAEAHLPANAKAFEESLQKLSEKHPEADLGGPIAADAHRIMREADSTFTEKFSSAEGFSRWLAAFAGGAVGTLRDPLQAPLMLLGGAPASTAKSALGRIAQMGLREGAINAGSQALVEPSIEGQRAAAGLPSGLAHGAANVLFAGAIGAGLGAGGRALGEGVARAFRRAPLMEARSAASVALDEAIREGVAGRMAIGDRALRMMDADISTAVRSTLDLAKARRGMEAEARAAEVFGAGDPKRVARIAENFLTPEEAAPKPPQSLIDFLIDKGGVRDFQGEMKALGLEAVSQKFRGRLVKPKGLHLDRARELAAEAGYLGHPEQAGSGTTVADLLNALEEEHRGTPVYSMFDEDAVTARSAHDRTVAENEQVLAIVQKIEAAADKNLPDDVILRAAHAAMREDLDPVDALERVIMEDYRAGPEELQAPTHKGFYDTRGQGALFHGGGSEFQVDEGHYSSANIYGQGLYTTDAFDVSHGYAVKKNKGAVHQVAPTKGIKLLDMGQPVPEWLTDNSDLYELAKDEIGAAGTIQQLYDEIRAFSAGEGYSRESVQEIFEVFRETATEHGYRGLTHVGGSRTSTKPHGVSIFWYPEDVKTSAPLNPENFKPKPPQSPRDIFTPPDEAVPEPGMSDEALAAMAADQADMDDMMIPTGAALGEEGTEVTLRTLGDLLEEAKRGDELAALVAACNTEAA